MDRITITDNPKAVKRYKVEWRADDLLVPVVYSFMSLPVALEHIETILSMRGVSDGL